MRHSLIIIALAASFTSSLFGQTSTPSIPTKMPPKIPTKVPTKPAPAPTNPSQPIYGQPGYYAPYPHTPAAEPKIHTAKEQREQAKKEFEEKNAAKNSMTGQTRRSEPVKSDKAPEEKKITTEPSQKSSLPTGTYDSSKLKSDKSFAKTNIQKILIEQIGVTYSSDGQTPEDGFSPTGLLNYVGKKLGSTRHCDTAEEAWEGTGLHLKVAYGDFETGDILFFKLFSKSTQKSELFITMAIDNSHMVYSSFSKKKVVKTSYKTDFWKERFAGAKRILLK